jgi:hypothetical protein
MNSSQEIMDIHAGRLGLNVDVHARIVEEGNRAAVTASPMLS